MQGTRTFVDAVPDKELEKLSPAKSASRARTKRAARREATSEFSRRARVKVAVIYALTTIIPLLVMLYIIQTSILFQTRIDVLWISFLALIALGIALLGGKIMKEVWGKVSQAMETIEHLRKENDPLAETFDLKPTDEIDRIPTVVTHLVEIAKKQMSELKEYSEQVLLLNSRLKEANEKLHQLSREDSLTGLFNRRYFDDRVGHEIARTRRFGRELALAMIDIDFFKNYNDDEGHLAGDNVLATIGRIIRKSIRETDIAFRYGGEEFAIILPETAAESAMSVAERIRSAVEKSEFPGNSAETSGSLTVSIGVSTLGKDDGTLQEFVSAADKALYKAKSIGRNRVVAYSPD